MSDYNLKMFTFKEINQTQLRVSYRGINLGRLYFRPVTKNQKPEYSIVDMDELNVLRNSPAWHSLRKPNKDKMVLAKLMLDLRKVKKVA